MTYVKGSSVVIPDAAAADVKLDLPTNWRGVSTGLRLARLSQWVSIYRVVYGGSVRFIAQCARVFDRQMGSIAIAAENDVGLRLKREATK